MFTQFYRSTMPMAVALATCFGMTVDSDAQGNGESIQIRELKAALAMSQSEARGLKETVARKEAQRKVLVESLAEAVRVSEEQLVSARETKLKLEAFGIDLFAKEDGGLEQRLLKAVRDLDISRQEIERQSSAIQSLSEAFLQFVATNPEADDKMVAKAQDAIQKASSAIAPTVDPASSSYDDSSETRVVSIDPEIGLIVFSAGRESGMRVGTPITVIREDRPIYTATIVDVRESISGAVLQDKVASVGDVLVGDGIKLLPN